MRKPSMSSTFSIISMDFSFPKTIQAVAKPSAKVQFLAKIEALNKLRLAG
jgi:hypothetical protein